MIRNIATAMKMSLTILIYNINSKNISLNTGQCSLFIWITFFKRNTIYTPLFMVVYSFMDWIYQIYFNRCLHGCIICCCCYLRIICCCYLHDSCYILTRVVHGHFIYMTSRTKYSYGEDLYRQYLLSNPIMTYHNKKLFKLKKKKTTTAISDSSYAALFTLY